MLKKSIRKEDVRKIKEEILQVLEETFDWPGLFEKVWPEGRFPVTDALTEFFKIGGEECFPFGQKTTVSHFRVLKLAEKIFDNFLEYGALPFKTEVLSYNKFVQAFIEIKGIFYRYVKLIDIDSDDVADEKDIGHEPGIAY